MVNVVLINPPYTRYGGIKGHGGSVIPLNLCYLAAYIKKFNDASRVNIIDAELYGMTHEKTVTEALKYSADIVGITTNTGVFDSVIELTRAFKRQSNVLPIVLGGPHVSALPRRSLEESAADFVVMGEGEITLEELLRCLGSGPSIWRKIKGLAFKNDDGHVEINEKRELIEDLDILPFPARELVDNKLYVPPPTKRVALGPNTLIATSRGCSFDCGFCGAKVVWARRVRCRSIDSVVKEIEGCFAEYGIKSFNFTDEFFTANKNRVLELCREFIKRKLDIAWVCSARAQHLDRETLVAMKEAGCHEISFGIESGNQEMLEAIDKSLDLKEARRVISLTKKTGIRTHASYMIGYIGETNRSIEDTIEYAKKLNTHVAAFFIASPLPGTKFYKEALDRGYIRDDATWGDYSPLSHNEPVLKLPGLTTASLKEWHGRALKQYYFRFGYIAYKLYSIRHWYEVVNLYEGLKMFFRIKRKPEVTAGRK